jgi:hypothetical protein
MARFDGRGIGKLEVAFRLFDPTQVATDDGDRQSAAPWIR